MSDKTVLQEYLINSKAPKAVLNALRSLEAVHHWSALWKQSAKLHRKFGLQMAERVEGSEQQMHDEAISHYK